MDPKDLLLKHFEKLIAAAFGGWLIYTVVAFAALKPAALGQNEQLSKNLEQIQSHMDQFEVVLEPMTDPTRELRKQLDPGEVGSAEGYGTWVMHRRPNFLYDVASGPKLQYPVHKPPAEFRVTDKGRKRVSLAWKASSENQFIKILRYDVQRKDGEAGEYKTVDSVGGDKNEYTDGSVGSKQKYWYRLIEHADTDRDDPVIAHDKTELADDARDLKAEDIADPVETPQDKYITIDSGTPPDPTKDGDAAKGSVDLKVWVWHAGTNQFVYKNYRGVLENKKPGQLEKNFMINKKAEPVDFTTDAEIVEVGSADHQRKGQPTPIKTIYAKIHWPWMPANAEPETIWEKENPEEIAKQVTKGKP